MPGQLNTNGNLEKASISAGTKHIGMSPNETHQGHYYWAMYGWEEHSKFYLHIYNWRDFKESEYFIYVHAIFNVTYIIKLCTYFFLP